MRPRWLRYWPVFLVVLAALAVAGFYLVADYLTQEPPNYTLIEDGLWMGGRVKSPPPRVRAVLNLCEAEDPYQAEVHRWEPIPDGEPVPTLDWLHAQSSSFVNSVGPGGQSSSIAATVSAAAAWWWPRS